jgi:hypothetical protein
MSEAILMRTEDPSGVSGVGAVAEIFEATDGAVAIRWFGEHPSWGLWPEIRVLEAIHGHEGLSTVVYRDPDRLVRAYKRAMAWMLSARYADRPVTCDEHPDHPSRLRLTFRAEKPWRFWIGLLDGSSHAATHVEVNGEIRHRWVTPDGDLWLEYFSPLADDNDPLQRFHEEDR